MDVLILDDNPDNLRVLANILLKAGYKARPSRDPRSALYASKRWPPDLILLDILMPGTNGYKVCEELKADALTRGIPVIFISALEETDDKVKAFQAGGVDYITKPFEEREVIARVRTHIALRQMHQQLEEQNKKLQNEISERRRIEAKLRETKTSLVQANLDLEKRIEKEVGIRMEQQQMLIQKSKLESLGKLAAGIAHEINQPLSGIAMGLDNISFKLGSGKLTDEYLDNKIELFRQDIKRINHIIEHVRTFSRDQRFVMFENIDVNEVCENALSMLRTSYENHRVEIEYFFGVSLGFVLGNRYKLEQVVVNLISNARDAVEEKYDLLGETAYQKKISVRTYFDDDRIYIEIADNGSGIREEDLEHIFEPFFTTKDVEHGTGLGLSISYGIIREMKGDIAVESKPGEYTIMRISLPRFVRRDA